MIRGFECVRADGRVIDESMTLDRMIDLGWIPNKVVQVCWRWKAQRLCLANHFGLLAMVVPDRQRLAVLWNHDAQGQDATLYVVEGDNQRLTKVPNEVVIKGKAETVTYSWLERSENESLSAFTCICIRRRDQSMYRVEIDARNATTLSVTPSR